MSYDFYIGKYLNGEGLANGLDRAVKPVIEAAVHMVMKHNRAFSVGGHHLHGGERWKPLAPSTIRAKGHGMILVDKGVLRSSVHFKTIRALRDGFIVDIGTNVEYAKYHQKGGGKLPQRKVVSVTVKDQRDLAEGFALWAEKELNGQFRKRLSGPFDPFMGAA